MLTPVDVEDEAGASLIVSQLPWECLYNLILNRLELAQLFLRNSSIQTVRRSVI